LTRTDAQQKQEPLPFWLVMYHSTRDGILAAKDPQILLGYLASFLARSDSLSITLYVPLWVYKYYVEQGLCPDIPGAEAKYFCREAYVKASILSGVTQVFALVGAPVFGYLLDKWNRYLVVFLASLLAGLGYFFFSFQSNPLAGINYIFLFLIGFGEIGLVVSSVTLITNSSIPNHARGSIAGIASFFGAAGILVSSKVGGLLFDWYSGGPFLYLGLVHFVMLGTFMIYFLWIKRQSVRSFFVPSHVAM
jgi:MFS family permease